jgi:hypothetical protein
MASCASPVQSFLATAAGRRPASQLHFGIPSFTPKDPQDKGKGGDASEKKIGLSSVIQLITAGAGAPFLGDFEGVDKETGRFMFSLEANNLVDEDGNSKQTQMPYFESGWVDPDDSAGFKWPWEKKK